jgi:putative nucleotidyltransferase with HDIG domain
MTATLNHDRQADPRQVDLRTVLSEIDDLPSIPETLIRILKVLDDPASGPADLAVVVRMDGPLMAKILRLANSPYYSSRGDLADINRCVAVLGYKTVRQVAICVAVASSLVSAVDQSGGAMDYRELWRHSVITGAIAKHLARMTGYPDPEEVFTAGLLHDMGKFVLEIYSPQEYGRLIQRRGEQGRPLVDVEREHFGWDHAALGAAFAESWRFPAAMAAAFADHHTPLSAEPARDNAGRMSALVALADHLANTLAPPRSDLGYDADFVDQRALYARADLAPSLVEQNVDALSDAVDKAAAFLNLHD